MKKTSLGTILQVIVFISLGIGLIYWRYTVMDAEAKQAMFAAFRNIKWVMLIPIFIVALLSHFFRALRWNLLLETVAIKPKIANTTFAVIIGYLINTILPRFGEIGKCTILSKYEDAPVDKSFGTIVSERVFDMVSMLAILFATLILEREQAMILFEKYVDLSSIFGAKLFIILGIGIVGLLAFIYFYKKIRHSKIGKMIGNLIDGMRSILRLKKRGYFLLYTILIWLMYTLGVYLAYFTLGETTHLGFGSALAIVTFGSFGMIATPGGIGTYPIIVSGVLFLYGINEGVGLAFGWISWGAQTLIVLILGLLSLLLMPIYNNRNGKITTHTRQNN